MPRQRSQSALLPLVLGLALLSVASHAQKVNCRLEKDDNDYRYVCDDVSDRMETNPTLAPVLGVSIDTTLPTPLPVETLAPTVYDEERPKLNYVGEQPHGSRLQNCEGDCNTDLHCAYGLNCFKRNGLEPVPGCSGKGIVMVDYCYQPPPGTLVLMGNHDSYVQYPLQKCQGNCKNDDDCAGELRCWERDLYDMVPGCEGFGAKNRNYCYDVQDTASPTSEPTAPLLLSDFPSTGFSDIPSTIPSDVPSLSPSAAFASLVPTGALSCDKARQQLERCFATELDACSVTACDKCVVDLIAPDTEACGDLASLTCGALAICDCGPCTETLEMYLTCGFEEQRGCTIDCDFSSSGTLSSTPSDAPSMYPSDTPSSSPTSVPAQALTTYKKLRTELQFCFEMEMDKELASACDTCIASAVPGEDATCGEVESLVCSAVDECPCTPCTDIVEKFLSFGLEKSRDCVINCDALSMSPSSNPNVLLAQLPTVSPSSAASNIPSDFPSISPTSAPSGLPSSSPSLGPMSCSNAQEYLYQCFQKYYTQTSADACDKCITDLLPPPETSCGDIESLTCQAIDACPCSLCKDVVENYMNCGFMETVGCQLDCDYPSRPPSSNPSEAPISLPSVAPSAKPSPPPRTQPTSLPSLEPTVFPSAAPTWGEMTTLNAKAYLSECFAANLTEVNAVECDACVVSGIPDISTSCGDLESIVCNVIDSCPCSACAGIVEAYLNLGFERDRNCSIDCNQLSLPPSAAPSDVPSSVPSTVPSARPSIVPRVVTSEPSPYLSDFPSTSPSMSPSDLPSDIPSYLPSGASSVFSSSFPSSLPDVPSSVPSTVPSDQPSIVPRVETSEPSPYLSDFPSTSPSMSPSDLPSYLPSGAPSASPSSLSSSLLNGAPSTKPSYAPSEGPTATPSDLPSDFPTSYPSDSPSIVPSSLPSDRPNNMIDSGGANAPPSDLPLSPPSGFLSAAPSKGKGSKIPVKVPTSKQAVPQSASPSDIAGTSRAPSDLPLLTPTGFLNAAPSKGKGSKFPVKAPTSKQAVPQSASPSDVVGLNINLPSIMPSNQLTRSNSPALTNVDSEESASSDCNMTEHQRMHAVTDVLAKVSPRHALALHHDLTPHSPPESRALSWLLKDDTAHLCSDDPKLSQRFILALLYFETNGAWWNRCSSNVDADKISSDCDGNNFLSQSDECAWGGVVCNGRGFVTGIHLSSNNITGRIPHEFGSLTFLEEIDMERNNLTGKIPGSLGKLANIQYIDLDKNQLTGDIPHELFHATSLRVLDLDSNQLVGDIPPHIGELTNLYYLQLDFNKMKGNIPSELGSLTQLQYVSLLQNEFTSPLPKALCDQDIQLYADCSLCPTAGCCTACLD